jgi:hypothetical protein
MAITCDYVRELASGFVLGALEPDETAAVRDHLDTCREPHPELAEFGGILPYLAVTPEPLEPPAWLRGSVISAARADLLARERAGRPAERQPVEPAVAMAAASGPAGHAAEVIPFDAARRSRRRTFATWATRVAAVVAVVSLAGYAFVIQRDLNQAKQDENHAAAVLYVLSQPDARSVPLIDNEGKGAGGIAVLRPNGHIVVNLNHLSATSGDQTYMVWLTGESNVVAKVGWFTVGDDGKGFLEVDNVPTSPSMWIFICREPNSKVTQPTGPTILSGTITL